ncbi:hypothetical protein M0811_14091 [Anaeramoeba ignava]|uniref:Uncharacterized protein n=1 Tax=Anaeramoeba ignava TaxID=1746090 RepID=A0A9Q0LWX9_ANAIG|nr:hypothetical protein M0811_14091 [Anaeramoeba ignava]
MKIKILSQTKTITLEEQEFIKKILSLDSNSQEFIQILNEKFPFKEIDIFGWIEVLNKFDEIFEKEKLKESFIENLTNIEQFNKELIIGVLKFTKQILKKSKTHIGIYNSEEYIKRLLDIGEPFADYVLELVKVLYSKISPSNSNFSAQFSKNPSFTKIWQNELFSSLFTYSQISLITNEVHKFTFLDFAKIDENLKMQKELITDSSLMNFSFVIKKEEEKDQEKLLQQIQLNFSNWFSEIDELKNLSETQNLPEYFFPIIHQYYNRFKSFQKGVDGMKQNFKTKLIAFETLFSISSQNNPYIKQISKNYPDLVQELYSLALTDYKIENDLRFLSIQILMSIYRHAFLQAEIIEKAGFTSRIEVIDTKTIPGLMEYLMADLEDQLKEDPIYNFRFLKKLSKFILMITKTPNAILLFTNESQWILGTINLIKDENPEILPIITNFIEIWFFLLNRNTNAVPMIFYLKEIFIQMSLKELKQIS